MLGFIFGTVCLVGLIKTLRGGCGYGGRWGGGHCGGGECGGGRWGGGWGGHHHHGHGRWGGRGDWHRWALRGLFERLDTTPGQEKVILEAADNLRSKGREAREVMFATAGDAARGMRGERFDESTMAAAFARQNEALAAMQKAAVESFAKVHEALDERQRRELADLMDRGVGTWGRWGGGPYRV